MLGSEERVCSNNNGWALEARQGGGVKTQRCSAIVCSADYLQLLPSGHLLTTFRSPPRKRPSWLWAGGGP